MRFSPGVLSRVLRYGKVTGRSTNCVTMVKTIVSLPSASSSATASATLEPQGATTASWRALPPSSKESIENGGDYLLRWGSWCLAGAGVAAALNRDASGDEQVCIR